MDSARQVGPYTVETEIGRGGMGVVYRGRDSRLERPVAIKTLPPSVVADEVLLSRFVREARLLAGLSHPNIATVYGLEQDAAGRYLVMELVDGETLSQRVARGRLTIQDALSVAAQIAAGVEAAHERGIIHRDLKPGNVMVGLDGTVKVLDFGLAQQSGPRNSQPPGGNVAQAVTRPRDDTRDGIAVGTPGYMSPEQARGQEVDRRTDVFALGCVLFECLSGSCPFGERTRADSIAATLDREPEWALLPERTPPRVRDLLEHCLQKDVKRRLRDVGDARLELERAIERREWATTGSMRAARSARRSWKGAAPWGVAAVALAGMAVTGWHAWGPGPESPAPERRSVVRFLVNEPEARDLLAWDVPTVAISDDGSMVAFNPGPARGVFVRRLEDARPVRLDLVEVDAHSLAFSPDGRWLAYTSGFSLFQVPVDGGQRVRLFQGDGIVKGFCWAPGGMIISSGITSGLARLDTKTATLATLTTPDRGSGEVSHRWPDLLPDGRHVLFTIKRSGIETFDEADIALLDMETGQWRVVIEGGTYARYAPTGHIVYARAGGLMAAPFDVASGRITAAPIEVMRGVTTEPGSGAAQFALSRGAGTLVFVPGAANVPRCDLVFIGLDGSETPTTAAPRNYSAAIASPDGRRIAAHAYGATDSVFVYDADRGTTTRVTFDGNASSPFWSRDGRRIAFTSDRAGPSALYVVNADGSGEVERFPSQPGGGVHSFVEFEGQESILSTALDGLWVRPSSGGEPRRIVSTPMPVIDAAVSPDQRWVAYTTFESGQAEVYVRPFPTGEGRWQVSTGGGFHPQWLPDSNGVVYRQDSNPLRVARWSARSPAEARSELFCQHPPNLASLEVLPSANGLVAVRRSLAPTEPWRVEAVLHWLDDLHNRVPTAAR